jgi:hypothetical protein
MWWNLKILRGNEEILLAPGAFGIGIGIGIGIDGIKPHAFG